MAYGPKIPIEKRLSRLLSGPKRPWNEFILSGCTLEHVYKTAFGLRASLSSLVCEDTVVCLCAESKAVIAAALLCTLMGGPPLVLPYAHSSNMLSEMRNSAEFQWAIVDSPMELPHGVQALDAGSVTERISDQPLITAIDPDRELVRLYTGGTTAAPKIWSKTARNLFSEAFYLADTYHVTEYDRIVAGVSPYHIYGLLYSVMVPLVSGAGVAEETCTFPNEIMSSVETHAATVFIGVPMHYRALRGRQIPGRTLRIAFSSAGMLDENDGDDFYHQNGIGVTEIYGSTETGGVASRCRAKGESAFCPFHPIEWKIVDEHLQVKSEFISPEIRGEPDGFFITGDRAESYEGNGFRLIGRADHVVKVAGKRVDMQEIRDKILGIQGVNDSFVVSVPVGKGRENAIAALVEGRLQKETLMQTLSELLEPYAVPRSIRIVDKIPSTSRGKYDRKAIEELFQSEFRSNE